MIRSLKVILVAVAISLLGATAATAAEMGGDCVANASKEGLTVVGLSSAGSSRPMVSPITGLVTGWRMQVAPGLEELGQQLTVLRPTGKANELRAVGGSDGKVVEEGANKFGARVSVRAGDRLGLTGFSGTFFCANESTDTSLLYGDEVSVTEAKLFEVATGIGMPVTATVEPDADHDGYGDESQDECPTSAAYHQVACSAVKLTIRAKARRRSIALRVKASMDVSVQVTGWVEWGFESKRKSSGGRSKPAKLVVSLPDRNKDIAAGKVGRFAMALPKEVMRRLGSISPRKSLKAVIKLRVTDSEGARTKRTVGVELKGQEGS